MYVLLLLLSLTCSAHSLCVVNQTEFETARDAFEKTISANPANAQAFRSYADLLAEQDDSAYYESALRHYIKATQLEPNNLQTLFSLGAFACRIGAIQESLDAYIALLKQNPLLTSVLYNSGFSFKTAGYNELAIRLYEKILQKNPSYEPAHLGLAFALISQGRYQDGWREHLWNLQKQGKDSPELRSFLENGTVAGKRILLVPEGGLGDTIQFVRYAQRLKVLGAHITVVSQPALIPLLQRCPFIDELVPMQGSVGPYDAKATLMSLATFFGDAYETLPQNIPYLHADPNLIELWHKKTASDSNFKIGICWQPDVHNDVSRLPIARRGVPLSLFKEVANISGVTLYNLQKKEGLSQLSEQENLRIISFEDFDEEHGSFMDSAALMHSLDLIITADTATAHLAGALGKRVWLLLPYAIDWRWLPQTAYTPWYPTMRIFQQTRPFDWKSVLKSVTSTLCSELIR